MALHSYKQGDFSDTLVEKQRNGCLGSDFLDTTWSGVGSHMADHELEEGEACDDPDSGCDPDTAFPYLDEKLFMVLGDVQKYFEGGVSAEKLGSKFGGYGSFLPTQERTSSILLHDKPATAVVSDALCRSKKSSNEGLVEKIRRTAAGASVQASNFKAGGSSAVVVHENGGREAAAGNEKMGNNESSFAEGKVEQNLSPPKKVLLRFKVGSDKSERTKNTTKYSEFGLDNSSSASEDEDLDEDQDSDEYLSPDRTPLTMIRIMTSHHIPDGLLLSPLPDLLAQKERLWSTANLERLNENARSPFSQKGDLKLDTSLVKDDKNAFEKMDTLREKTRQNMSERKGDSAVSSDQMLKRAKGEKEKIGSKDSSRRAIKQPLKTLAKDIPKSVERDAVSDSGTGLRSIESHKEFNRSSLENVAPGYSIYEAEEHVPKDFCSPFPPLKEVDPGREVLSRGFRIEKTTASSSHDSMNDHLDIRSQRDPVKDSSATIEINSHTKRYSDSVEPLDGRKRKELNERKTNSNQDSKRQTSKNSGGKHVVSAADIPTINREFGRESPEARKRVKESVKETDGSRVSSKERVKEGSKESRKSSGKEKHGKTSSSKGLVMDDTMKGGPPQHTFKAVVSKDFQHIDLPKAQKSESMEHRRKEKSKDRVRPYFKEPHKLLEEDRPKELAMRDVFTKPSQSACAPEAISTNQPLQPAVPPAETGNGGLLPPYVLVMENWVACDKCEKWRLLPPGVNDSDLPSQWRCKMIYWLEGMNNCNVSEEVTSKATRALYNTAAPAAQPVQENPPALEQIQPPAPVAMPLSSPSVNPSLDIKAPDKTRAISNKKRKIPSATSNEVIGQSKSKSLADTSQLIQEANEAKLGGGESNKDQDRLQVKLGAPDTGQVKIVDDKRKAKEREKAKRPRINDGASPFGKEHNQTPANLALRNATNLKHTADRVKASKEGDCTGLYLQAALQFLQAASMLESEASEHGESRNDRLPQNIYADTAKLCRYCAINYERSKDLAAAALAYKCMGLALMRVVQAKSMHIGKDKAEMESAHLQVVRPMKLGESPSSSTDVDAHNNLKWDKVPARGMGSPAANSDTGGSFVIAAKSRSSFNRVLQYVADTNAALDALSKAHSAFNAAQSASMYSAEGVSALKRVLDFSFHDVMSLVKLVRLALDATGH